jgi:NADPH:quinone reductase-like Zn-dependent oxidoreductase
LKEFAAVKATEVAVKPASWSFEEAASLPYVLVNTSRNEVACSLGETAVKDLILFAGSLS